LGCPAEIIWYKDVGSLRMCDAVVIPGGFSYGDYLRAGAIAARTPVMDVVRDMAEDGVPILGICNGFQVLTESHLLEGALMINEYPKFICKWCTLRVEENESPFTSKFDVGELIRIPIAHKEGRYYHTKEGLERLNASNLIALRYVDENGEPNASANPNGSVENIAGILNEKKNVMGLMPHPERACNSLLGSEDGRRMIEGIIEFIKK